MKITSANNWLVKAGAHFLDDKLILPLNFLLVPMWLASEAMMDFKKSKTLNDRIKYGIIIVTMVRIADTGYFRRIARMIQESNKWVKIKICEHCIRWEIWPWEIKKYRKMANENLIHKMEEGLPINNQDLEVVELYYEELFKHPLTNPIHWEARKGIPMCKKCLRINNKNK